MKNLSIWILCLMLLYGCEKENLLENSALEPNPYENFDQPFVEISKTSLITCDILSMDLEVYHDRIPDTIVYTHFRIEDPFGEIIETEKTSSIIMNCRCDEPSEYRISLYNDEFNRKTASYLYVVEF